MIYKFAAADMDGTLLNDKNEITPSKQSGRQPHRD